MNGGSCDFAVSWQMQKCVSAGRPSDGVKADAVKGAGSRGVGWFGLIVG